MAPAYYIYKYPYKLAWNIAKFFKRNKELVFYCADPLDYEMFLPIKKYLKEIEIVAKNKKSRDYLKKIHIPYLRMPVFPKAVIMARHAPHKFPVEQIAKIGFDHGLYQFKKWTSPENYNRFNRYFVSSPEQVKTAETLGITTTKAIGYPKLDNAFNGTYNKAYLDKIKTDLNLDVNKPTIILTSTWNVDGLSALDRWIDRVGELTEKYNVLITVHTWTEKSKIEKLKVIKNAFFLDKFDVTTYLMIADVFIGDYNSLIGEACALDKPIITFRVPESKRSIKEITKMIESISIRIDEFDELHKSIEQSVNNPEALKLERENANKIMFLALDGTAGKRVAEETIRLLQK
ncbi:MAG: CDP-glycerol glycerophosphotransferase family protein [Melioribacteraceae bacterium]|jgi:CDP-glycerol glycerophosphotransferase (TagB/SpsB family)|nr:CDP-glycerol glycerophosphotransferase family protein [Melioribacteraceae bacterium]